MISGEVFLRKVCSTERGGSGKKRTVVLMLGFIDIIEPKVVIVKADTSVEEACDVRFSHVLLMFRFVHLVRIETVTRGNRMSRRR